MTPDLQKTGSSPSSRLTTLLITVLLLMLAGQAVSSMQQKSVTTDEIMYIAAGYYHLRTGDFQMNMTNTPLMKVLSAAPLLLVNPDIPPRTTSPKMWSLTEQWQYARVFLYQNRIDADQMLFLSRLPIVLVAMLLGCYVFQWSSILYGEWAGLAALFLFSFSPNVLAHARLATHDLGLAAFMFIATYYFWRYMKQPALRLLLMCGLFSGLALLAKTTAMFLAPIFGGYVLICVLRKNGQGIFERLPWIKHLRQEKVQARQVLSGTLSLAIIGAVVLVVLNLGYGFDGTLQTTASPSSTEAKTIAPVRTVAGTLTQEIPLPLPAPFVEMIRSQRRLVSSGGAVYFAGSLHQDGAWYLTLVAFLLKTPIPLLLLFSGAVFYFLRHCTSNDEWILLLFVTCIFFVFSLVIKVNASVRYVLPIYPILHVFASSLFRPGAISKKWMKGLIGLLLLWYMGSSVSTYPHYLAYFNEFVGGPRHGYAYLTDSNLDWGQDLKGLKAYMRENNIEKVKLGYFGSADATYYDIAYEYLPSVGLAPQQPGQLWWYEMDAATPRIEPQPGVYAISATLIASPAWMTNRFYDAYTWFREHPPDDQVGYSILIYNIE